MNNEAHVDFSQRATFLGFLLFLDVWPLFSVLWGVQGVTKRGPWGAPQLWLNRSYLYLILYTGGQNSRSLTVISALLLKFSLLVLPVQWYDWLSMQNSHGNCTCIIQKTTQYLLYVRLSFSVVGGKGFLRDMLDWTLHHITLAEVHTYGQFWAHVGYSCAYVINFWCI